MGQLYTIPSISVLTVTYLTNEQAEFFGGNTVVGGDVIEFQAGNQYRGLILQNLIGTKENPIVIDLNGQSISVEGNNWTAVTLENCDHLLFINGSIINVGTQDGTFCIFGRTGSFKLNAVDTNGGATAISFKNDPYDGTDFLAQRASFTDGYASDYVELLNCNFLNAKNECLYIGASHTDKWFGLSTDKSNIYQQPLIKKITVDGCTIPSCGSDGVQVAASHSIIRNSNISNHGSNSLEAHKNGIQAGCFGKTEIYNNFIDGGGLNGRGIFAMPDDALVFNNIIKNVEVGAYDSLQQNTPNTGMRLFHNTFIDISRETINHFNRATKYNKAWNNIFHLAQAEGGAGGGLPAYYVAGTGDAGLNMDEAGKNLEIAGAQSKIDNFTDSDSGDFTLKTGSLAIGYCDNLSSYNSKIIKNRLGVLRPIKGVCDAGAY